ncbi:MAG: hypothetical protein JW736_01390 [Deltaproteobacteria bacterium]|nr:hypothetical protein [Deltaproteobacteria bacterium]MBN2686568.1 hypothetical protein [Deltaproteobacteria bacterium]
MKLTQYLMIIVAAVCLSFGGTPLLAADEMDLLNDLDQEMSTEKGSGGGSDLDLLDELDTAPKEKEADALAYVTMLGSNFEGSIRLRGHVFYRDPVDREDVDKRNPVGEALLRFNTWTGNDKLRLTVAGWLEAGTQQDTYEGIFRWPQDKDRQRHYLDLNELYLSFFQDSYDITVGKKIFQNGISTLFSPADRYRPADSNDPMDPKDFGIWQTRVDYYIDKFTVTAAILPIYSPEKQPSPHSRWSDTTGDFDIYDKDTSNKEIEEDFPTISINNVSYFGRVKTTLAGWDLFVSAYHGLNPYYVLREENRGGTTYTIKENIKVGNYAAGFSTAYKKWEFHGETLFNFSYDRKDDHYFTFVGGFTYTMDTWARKIFMEKIDITIEYANEVITKKQSAEGYVESSRKGRLGKNDIFARINFKYNQDLSFQYISDFELDPSGRYNKIQSEYKIRPGLLWTVAAEFFNGKDDSYYGRWARNDRLITALKYSF